MTIDEIAQSNAPFNYPTQSSNTQRFVSNLHEISLASFVNSINYACMDVVIAMTMTMTMKIVYFDTK